MVVRIEHADMLEAIPRLVAEGMVCDACVTDPPYHLTATQKRFSAADAAPAQHGRDGAMLRLSGGFMGQTWDGGDIAFRPETWVTVATILRPGAFLVAFGGTRTYHRLACAIEDGGFVIQDCISYLWVFGTGFPKRRDMLKPAAEFILKAQKPIENQIIIDIIGSDLMDLWGQLWSMLPANDAEQFSALAPPVPPADRGKLASAQTNASVNQGVGMGGSSVQTGTPPSASALIGSLSTVSLWQDTWVALCELLSTSTIGTELNTTIDWKILRSCLLAITPESIIQAHRPGRLSIANASPAIRFFAAELMKLQAIRAPSAAELATLQARTERQGAGAVEIEPIVLAYKPGGKRTMQIDECRISTAGETIVPNIRDPRQNNPGWVRPWMDDEQKVAEMQTAAYSRMQSLGRWPANVVHDGSDEVLAAFPDSAASVAAKRNGRDDGSVFALARKEDRERGHDDNGGSAARFFMSAKAGRQDRWGSRHPTVKPVELMKWLVKLVCPEGGLLLDPFAGSGTTGVAALAAGRNAILIERENAYVADIRERMAHYAGEGRHSLASRNRHSPEGIGALRDGGRTAAVSQERSKLPLFSHRPYDEAADARDSYTEAVRAIGERVKAGAPVPDFFRSEKA